MDKDYNEDEIIDLEDDDIEDSVEVVESDEPSFSSMNSPRVSPQMPNITKRGKEDNQLGSVLNKHMMPNSDKSTPQKLQNLGKNNRSFPPLGGSSFSNQEEDDGLKENVQDKVVSKGITAATGGAIQGKAADKLAEVARKSGALDKINPLKKYKWFIIGGLLAFFMIIFSFMLIFIAVSDKSDLNQKSDQFFSSEITEEEIIKQLIYFGYCNDIDSCKKQGVYKNVMKLKELNEKYSKKCDSNIKISEPCGVKLNNILILETLNYYENSYESYDSKETGVDDESINIQGFFGNLLSKWKEQKRINKLLDDVEKLADAQVEYVEETCKKNETDKTKTTLKYFQVNLDKYASYLAYGETSSHPNYKGEPVKIENEICIGQQNNTNIATPSGE